MTLDPDGRLCEHGMTEDECEWCLWAQMQADDQATDDDWIDLATDDDWIDLQ